MPILDSIGSVKGYGWGAFSIPPAFESIATATGTGSSGTITFSSIPGTYQHLQLRIIALDTTSANSQVWLLANGATSGYSYHNLYGNGTTVTASGSANFSRIFIAGFVSALNATYPNVSVVDIHDYASTTKYKTVRVFTGFDRNGTGEVGMYSGLYQATTAISSLDIKIAGSNFSTTTIVALYGIKGA